MMDEESRDGYWAAIFFVCSLLLLNGCAITSQVSDEELAQGVHAAAKGAARFGLKYAMDKEPDKADEIAANARLAVEVIRKNVLPVFSGTSQEVLRSAIETALEQLAEKLKPSVISGIQLALDVVSAKVDLPENPAERVSPRAKAALEAFFRGVADGLDSAAGTAGTREIGPAKLRWPKK